MRSSGRWVRVGAAVALLAAVSGCGERPETGEASTAPAPARPAEPPAEPVEPQLVLATVQQAADSADRLLRKVPNLTGDERSRLRRDVNELQVARARQLGVRVVSDVDPLVRAGRLVRLADSTEHWVVRELDYSEPYLTPAAESMLLEIGERFHARLDSLGVPRFRLDITSVLRTPEKQAALRRTNRNASRTESSHEFGTTLDIAYRRFAPPAHEDVQRLAGTDRMLADSTFIETGRLRGAELQAVLGRVLLEMQREGKLMVIMERSQTVFHITVARRLPRRGT